MGEGWEAFENNNCQCGLKKQHQNSPPICGWWANNGTYNTWNKVGVKNFSFHIGARSCFVLHFPGRPRPWAHLCALLIGQDENRVHRDWEGGNRSGHCRFFGHTSQVAVWEWLPPPFLPPSLLHVTACFHWAGHLLLWTCQAAGEPITKMAAFF